MVSKQCKYVKADGSQCGGYSITDSEFCFFHVADGAAARLAGWRGGKSSKASSAATKGFAFSNVSIDSIRDVISLLQTCINEVRKGEVDSRVANSVGYLANILVKAMQQGELQRRIENLEKRREFYASLCLDSSPKEKEPEEMNNVASNQYQSSSAPSEK